MYLSFVFQFSVRILRSIVTARRRPRARPGGKLQLSPPGPPSRRAQLFIRSDSGSALTSALACFAGYMMASNSTGHSDPPSALKVVKRMRERPSVQFFTTTGYLTTFPVYEYCHLAVTYCVGLLYGSNRSLMDGYGSNPPSASIRWRQWSLTLKGGESRNCLRSEWVFATSFTAAD